MSLFYVRTSDGKYRYLLAKQKTLDIDQIRTDGGTQSRVGITQAVVDEYAADIEAPDDENGFPAIKVVDDGKSIWLTDGFHRLLAAKQRGDTSIACEVYEATQSDAQWFSYSVNQAHGLRRSPEDKRHAVGMALLHPTGKGASDRDIAEHVGVSHPLVGKVRAELEKSGRLETVTSRTGADGRTINVSNIGTRPKPTPCCNCGCTERDDDGDCAECHEPADTVNTPPTPVKPKTTKPPKAKPSELSESSDFWMDAVEHLVVKWLPRYTPAELADMIERFAERVRMGQCKAQQKCRSGEDDGRPAKE
jgi:hypothetical protein